MLLAAALLSPETFASFTLGLDQEFSGGTPPVSSSLPWVTATFHDNGDGTVNFILSNPHLSGRENVSKFYFNFDDRLDVNQLSFSVLSTSGIFTGPSVDKGKNAYKADGDGMYDVRINFATGGPPNTFGAGDLLVLKISYTSSIDSSAFGYLSAPAGGHGPFYAAAHVQNTGTAGGDSGWISPLGITAVPVPEPTTMIAGALLLLPFGANAIRFLRKHRVA